MTIILAMLLLASVLVIVWQKNEIRYLNSFIDDSLDWVEPAAIVKGEWDE